MGRERRTIHVVVDRARAVRIMEDTVYTVDFNDDCEPSAHVVQGVEEMRLTLSQCRVERSGDYLKISS